MLINITNLSKSFKDTKALDDISIAFERNKIHGIIIDNPGFYLNMNAYRNLQMLASLNRKISKQQIRGSISLVGLDPDSKKHVGKTGTIVSTTTK